MAVTPLLAAVMEMAPIVLDELARLRTDPSTFDCSSFDKLSGLLAVSPWGRGEVVGKVSGG